MLLKTCIKTLLLNFTFILPYFIIPATGFQEKHAKSNQRNMQARTQGMFVQFF
jgi:hypothetical protein